jgi:hypothetical protein
MPPASPELAPANAPGNILMNGCPVLLKGLVAKPEWNGRRARIVGFLHEAGKYEIRMEDVDVTVRARPENIEVIVKETKKQKLKRKATDEDSAWASRKQLVMEAVKVYISENEKTWTKSLMKEEIAEKLGLTNDNQMAAMVTMALGDLEVKATGGLSIKGILSVNSPTDNKRRAL